MTFDAQAALRGCLLSNIAYDIGCVPVEGEVQIGSLAFLIRISDDVIEIGLRGSNNLKNFVIDAEGLLRTCSLLPDFGLMHEGFCDAVCMLAPVVAARLPHGKRLRIYGHSLGAAEAQPLAAYLTQRGHVVEFVYGCGTPGIGDDEWVKSYQALGIPTFEIIHGRDGVTQMGAQHAGTQVFMDRHGNVLSGREGIENLFGVLTEWETDHSCDRYLVVLAKLADKGK